MAGYPGGDASNSGAVSSKDILNVLGKIKARVQDSLGVANFPMPQFILVGAQSVGKSRLIEALAGEQFNFCSGTLGSRRPTQLEFRYKAGLENSVWYMRDSADHPWNQHPVDGEEGIMKRVGRKHEDCGRGVNSRPIYVRMESSKCVDMQIVDLPGFRGLGGGDQGLADSIDAMVMGFMKEKLNVMLCVEQAADHANMATLEKCKEVDPNFERTVLIRNKFDKYYADLSAGELTRWIKGGKDLPEDMSRPARFALTLPHWRDGDPPPLDFAAERTKKDKEDISMVKSMGLQPNFEKLVGYQNFATFLEQLIEKQFVESIGPVLAKLEDLKTEKKKQIADLQAVFDDTDPSRMQTKTRDVGISFAMALSHVMEGMLALTPAWNLGEELDSFADAHMTSTHFDKLPEGFQTGLEQYKAWLQSDGTYKVSTFDVDINGGAQFRRLLTEVEIFLRFSELQEPLTKSQVIQARGVTMGNVTWREVVVKLLNHEAHIPLMRKITYVGERLKWFFEAQKEPVLKFMSSLQGTPLENIYSPLYIDHAKVLNSSPVVRLLVFKTYDQVVDRSMKQFLALWENVLTSMFSNPWVFLKGSTQNLGEVRENDDSEAAFSALKSIAIPSDTDTHARVVSELHMRGTADQVTEETLKAIPTRPEDIDVSYDMVQKIVLQTYAFIRGQVCDRIELFAESFFKLPMLRQLDQDMANIELQDEDAENYRARREQLGLEKEREEHGLIDVEECLNDLVGFKVEMTAKSQGEGAAIW